LAAEATKAGTTERVAALQHYAALAQQYYGKADVDAVQKANQQIVVAERELADTRTRFLEQWADEYRSVTAKNTLSELEATTRADKAAADSAKYQERTLEELSNYAQALDLKVTKEHSASLKEVTRTHEQQVRV